MKKEKWKDGWKLIKPGQTPIMAAMMGDAGRLRPIDPVYCELIGGPLSMKVVSNKYLLKNE